MPQRLTQPSSQTKSAWKPSSAPSTHTVGGGLCTEGKLSQPANNRSDKTFTVQCNEPNGVQHSQEPPRLKISAGHNDRSDKMYDVIMDEPDASPRPKNFHWPQTNHLTAASKRASKTQHEMPQHLTQPGSQKKKKVREGWRTSRSQHQVTALAALNGLA